MRPTQAQVIAWAREAGVHEQWFNGNDCPPIVFRLATLAYEAGRRDENEVCEATLKELLAAVSTGDEHMDGVWDAINAIRARREQ